jgi:hypothetical protein
LWGLGSLPNKHFSEIYRREIEAKKQGVYHLALLASLCDPQDMVPPACAFAAKTDIRVRRSCVSHFIMYS